MAQTNRATFDCDHVVGSITEDDLSEVIRESEFTTEVFANWSFESHNFCSDCGCVIDVEAPKEE